MVPISNAAGNLTAGGSGIRAGKPFRAVLYEDFGNAQPQAGSSIPSASVTSQPAAAIQSPGRRIGTGRAGASRTAAAIRAERSGARMPPCTTVASSGRA